MSHAKLSPSAASRWLVCTPSVDAEQGFSNEAGEAAKEGTLAHELSEWLIKKQLGHVKQREFEAKIKEIKANPLYNESMQDYCEDYCVYVVEQYHAAQQHTSDALIILEERLNLTKYIPEGFGTMDVGIVADRVLRTIDLKYGKGVAVSAEDNKQMMIYALGALDAFDLLYEIDHLHMTIYQPRLDNITDFQISKVELLKWAKEVLIPKAKQAYNGEGEYVAGSHCRFCRAKATCRAFAERQLEVAKYAFKESNMLSIDEIADILDRVESYKVWMTAVQDYAIDQAVNNGVHFPGYKVVESKSNRKYTDEVAVRKLLSDKGFKDEDYLDISLLPITKLEKSIGKGDFNTLLQDFIIKPKGSPTLAKESDKRKAYDKNEEAAKAFSNQ